MSDRILVTGGAGFIGSYLTDHFLAQGFAVRVLDNLTPQVHPQGQPDYLAAEAELLIGDVRDRQTLVKALEGVQVVIHCAAAVGVAQSMYRVQHYLDTNAGGMAALLEAVVECKPGLRRLVILTSMTSYGEGLYRRPSDGQLLRIPIRTDSDVARYGWEPVDPGTGEPLESVPTPEEAALLAQNIYALSKRYQEELALSLGQAYGIPVTCLRLFNVYGPRQSLSNPYTGVLAIFLSRLLNGEAPVIYEDGWQSRDFVSVHDVVRAAALAIETPAASGQVFNVGTGIARPIGDVARTLAHLVGRSDIEPKITGQFRKGDIRHCSADIRRIQSAIGFTPQVNWEASLKELIAWSATAPAADRFAQAEQEMRNYGLVK